MDVAMIARLMLLGSFLLVFVRSSSAVPQADVYASTAGRNDRSGRLADPAPNNTDGPMAMLERAKLRVAELRRQHPLRDRSVVIAIRGGTYYLDQPLELGRLILAPNTRRPDQLGFARGGTTHANSLMWSRRNTA
jgi:hypothetical protein